MSKYFLLVEAFVPISHPIEIDVSCMASFEIVESFISCSVTNLLMCLHLGAGSIRIYRLFTNQESLLASRLSPCYRIHGVSNHRCRRDVHVKSNNDVNQGRMISFSSV